MELYKILARTIPDLKLKLLQARMAETPEQYLRRTFVSSVFLGFALCFIVFTFLSSVKIFLFFPILFAISFFYFLG